MGVRHHLPMETSRSFTPRADFTVKLGKVEALDEVPKTNDLPGELGRGDPRRSIPTFEPSEENGSRDAASHTPHTP